MYTNEFTVDSNHLYVQCVTSGLHRKEVCLITKDFTGEKSYILVLNVRNVSQLSVT